MLDPTDDLFLSPPTLPSSLAPSKSSGPTTDLYSYLKHLDRCKEILGSRLNTLHNLHFYQELMRSIRKALHQGTFAAFAAGYPAPRRGRADPVA